MRLHAQKYQQGFEVRLRVFGRLFVARFWEYKE